MRKTMMIAALAALLAGCAMVDGLSGTPEAIRAHREFHVSPSGRPEVVYSGDSDSWNVWVSERDPNKILVTEPVSTTIGKGFNPAGLFVDLRRSESRFRAGAEAFTTKLRPGCRPESPYRMKGMPGYQYTIVCRIESAQPPPRMQESALQHFQKGVTTEAEVIQALGPPQISTSNSDGTRSVAYVYTHAEAKAASFIPIVGLFAGGATGNVNTVRFTFDAGGKLQGYESSHTDTDVKTGLGSQSTK
jgi:hypothetical protein